MEAIPFPLHLRKQQEARRAAAHLANAMELNNDLAFGLVAAWESVSGVTGDDFPPDVAAAAEHLRSEIEALALPFFEALEGLRGVIDHGLSNARRG